MTSPVSATLALTLALALSAGRAGAVVIPPEADEAIGHALFAARVERLDLIDDPDTRAATSAILRRIRSATPLPWLVHVGVVRSDADANAFNFGAGYVLVTSGMLNLCRTDAELAFVLSHEIAHGVLRHVPMKIGRTMDPESVRMILEVVKEGAQPALPDDLIVGFQAGPLGKALGKAIGEFFGYRPRVAPRPRPAPRHVLPEDAPARPAVPNTTMPNASIYTHAAARALYKWSEEHLWPLSEQVVQMNYDHAQELAADRMGVDLMTAARYDPAAAVAVLNRLPDSTWSATHPTNEKRIAAIRAPGPGTIADPPVALQLDVDDEGHRLLVARTQEGLQILGYYRGEIDGIEGPRTRRAIEEYQSDVEMRVSGKVSEPLLDHIAAVITYMASLERDQ